jgi:hypothetical protein
MTNHDNLMLRRIGDCDGSLVQVLHSDHGASIIGGFAVSLGEGVVFHLECHRLAPPRRGFEGVAALDDLRKQHDVASAWMIRQQNACRHEALGRRGRMVGT